MLTILKNIAWIVLPILGHALFWIGMINRVHGLRLRHRVVLPLQLFHFAWVPLASLAWVWAVGWHGPQLLFGGNPAHLAWPARWGGLAFMAVALLGLLRWVALALRPPARQIVSERRELRHPDRELVSSPIDRQARGAWWLSIPGNEILSLEIIELELTLPRLPPAWEGLRILHLSDLHFTGAVTLPFYARVFELARQHPCDLVVFTGDLLDDPGLHTWIGPTLGSLTAPLGCFYLLGNHDWEWGDVDRSRQVLDSFGWQNVGGQTRRLVWRGQPIVLAGDERPWWGPGPNWSLAEPGDFRLLLSHTPDNLPSARRAGVDLMLAGHTHGGQACLPVVGPVYSPSLLGVKYAGGTFDCQPTLLRVSRGVGGMYPWRWNCRPEITYLTLRTMAHPHLRADQAKSGPG
ncbi:MAG: metallophosphoesterase [Planctomycetaceae bacterium]